MRAFGVFLEVAQERDMRCAAARRPALVRPANGEWPAASARRPVVSGPLLELQLQQQPCRLSLHYRS